MCTTQTILNSKKNVRGDHMPLVSYHNHTPYKELNNLFAPVIINFLLVLTRSITGTPGLAPT